MIHQFQQLKQPKHPAQPTHPPHLPPHPPQRPATTSASHRNDVHRLGCNNMDIDFVVDPNKATLLSLKIIKV